jgi:hypothetical protein
MSLLEGGGGINEEEDKKESSATDLFWERSNMLISSRCWPMKEGK